MKRLGLLSAAVLLLAGFVYLNEFRWAEQREAENRLGESLFRLGGESVTSLRISRPGRSELTFEHDGGSWRIVEPVEAPADQSKLEALLGRLEGAAKARTFSQAGPQPAKYGLDRPNLILMVGAGGSETTLLMGSRDFSGSSVYVQFQGEEEAYLTSQALLEAGDQDLDEWRSRKVLDFTRNQVSVVEIENAGGRVRLEREGEEWHLAFPLSERADQSSVSGLLSIIEFEEARSFVSDRPEDLKPFGLESPSAEVRLFLEGGLEGGVLTLGRREEDGYLAQNSGSPSVFTVGPEVYEPLTQEVWAFRDKDVVDVTQEQVAELTLRRGSDEIVLAYEDYRWSIVEPESHRDRDPLAHKFWHPISDISFQSIEDAAPEESAWPGSDVELRIRLKDGSTRSFLFKEEAGRFLALKADTGRAGTISEDDYRMLFVPIYEIIE